MSEISDADLSLTAPALTASAGSEAFDALSRRLRPALMRYFQRRTESAADAEELVQELFLRLLRRADLFALQNLDGYVFEAAANLARDRARRQQARGGRHIDIDDIEPAADEPSPERVVDGRKRLDLMLSALDRLPPRARTIVILRRFESLTYGQIADRLGISVSAVEKHMVRSMSALRAALAQIADT
ncbi:RNA polymerase sigma factor [Brevundimonas sp. LM2]|uniref:RNA polymerase sigma factor n=1 Tax=Brevundimonas sp. LM2 TaxID=1938605 RepID=UPI00209AF230|nr:sigma-70 family RNA polymerase sigma factor [Brevundimonas sp. LM2]